jgi:flagellar hook-associated protein FlgK
MSNPEESAEEQEVILRQVEEMYRKLQDTYSDLIDINNKYFQKLIELHRPK